LEAADVDSDGADMRSLVDVHAESWTSEESVGSGTIATFSCGGTCGENWDGDVPRAEGVSMIGKWRQDGGSAAHTKHLCCISVAANFEIW